MPREQTDVSSAHMRQLRDEFPWVWLYEIEAPTDPLTRFRLTNYTEPIQFGTNTAGDPLVYSPLPIVHTEIDQTAEGDLPQFQIQVGHGSLELALLLEQTIGLSGQPVVVRVVNLQDLSSGTGGFEMRGETGGCKVSKDRVSLQISSLNLTEAIIPPKRFSRTHCNHAYGGPGCGYDLTNPTLQAAFPSCAYTYDACTEHGDAEVAAGLPRLHPFNWGAFRNIPRR